MTQSTFEFMQHLASHFKNQALIKRNAFDFLRQHYFSKLFMMQKKTRKRRISTKIQVKRFCIFYRIVRIEKLKDMTFIASLASFFANNIDIQANFQVVMNKLYRALLLHYEKCRYGKSMQKNSSKNDPGFEQSTVGKKNMEKMLLFSKVMNIFSQIEFHIVDRHSNITVEKVLK